MILSEAELTRLPEHLRRLFVKLPNPGSQEVLAGFPESKVSGSAKNGRPSDAIGQRAIYRPMNVAQGPLHNDSGSAARFFYCAKASKKDRAGSKHPTVKPVALLRYLCRLVTPSGGIILDPFAGTGTTGEAAILEGFSPILIEQEAEYVADIERRLASVR